MYLTKKTYIGNKYREPKERIKIKIPKDQKKAMFEVKDIKTKRITTISEEIGYWRKANAIHSWFVKNVQNGNDDCNEYIVEREELKKLLSLVNSILENHNLADKLLPCQEGSFFGDITYDKWYFMNLKDAKEILENAIKEKEGDIYYQSSW